MKARPLAAATLVVAAAVALALAIPVSLTLRRERARIEGDLCERATRSVQLGAALLRRDIARGRALLAGLTASRAVQDAVFKSSQSAVFSAIAPFRPDFDRVLIAVDRADGRPLAWSSPLAILGLGAPLTGSPPVPTLGFAAGDLALFEQRPIERDGVPVGRARAAILVGRLFLREASTELRIPLALYADGRLVHHVFPGDPPGLPPLPARDEATTTTLRIGGEDHEVAFLPLAELPGNAVLAAAVPRTAADAAYRGLTRLAWGSAGGALLVAVAGVVAFLALSRRQDELVRQRDDERRRAAGLSDRVTHLAAVVHDIKAPVGGIQLRCEQLLEDGPAPGVAAALGSVVETCEHLNLYLVNVLTAAQSEERPITPRREVVLVPGLVADVADHLVPAATRRQLALHIDVPPDLPPLAGDPVLLERALLNLASNAIAATPPGGTVALFARRAGSAIELGAWDTGPGFTLFAPEDAFLRARPVVKDASLRTGTGLGLYIVARIAQAHGGSARAANRPAGGAEASFSIPL